MQHGNDNSQEARADRRPAPRTRLSVLAGGLVLALVGAAALIISVPPVPPVEATPGTQIGLEVGNLAPDFSADAVAGDTIRLSALRGQVVILNFWATWCGPCVIEMPVLQRTYQQRESDGVVVLAINNRETATQIAPFRERFGLTFPILLDQNGAIQNQYAVTQYPSSLILDKEGVIVARHLGVLTPKLLNEILGGLLP
jgi:peroxiredoxin